MNILLNLLTYKHKADYKLINGQIQIQSMVQYSKHNNVLVHEINW